MAVGRAPADLLTLSSTLLHIIHTKLCEQRCCTSIGERFLKYDKAPTGLGQTAVSYHTYLQAGGIVVGDAPPCIRWVCS